MSNKVRTAAVATGAAVAGTTLVLALVGGLPAAADTSDDDTARTEWCDGTAGGGEWFASADHARVHNDHMGEMMGMGMGWDFDEMDPNDDMGDPMGRGMDFDEMDPDDMGDPMGRSDGGSMDRGRTMGR